MPLDFRAESLSVGPLNGKLIQFDFINVRSLDMALSGKLRLSWETLCTGMVLKGDTPGFVV